MLLRDALLRQLEQSKDKYVSGAQLAQSLGVSRNAVWKAANSLRARGHKIDSQTNRGYRLQKDSDLLSAQGITLALEGAASALQVCVLETVDSTNDEAKRRVAAGELGEMLIAASHQSAGRGRKGRSFFSPADSGVYMSFALRPSLSLERSLCITAAASVAVAQTIQELCGADARIKWVNDVYVGGKKVCGILTEAITTFEDAAAQCIIVGIGLNVTTAVFPKEISETAGSLPCAVSRNALCAGIANRLCAFAADLNDRSFISYYREYSLVLGERIYYFVKERRYEATAVGIDDDGGLIVRDDNGVQTTLRSGEITLRLAK